MRLQSNKVINKVILPDTYPTELLAKRVHVEKGGMMKPVFVKGLYTTLNIYLPHKCEGKVNDANGDILPEAMQEIKLAIRKAVKEQLTFALHNAGNYGGAYYNTDMVVVQFTASEDDLNDTDGITMAGD